MHVDTEDPSTRPAADAWNPWPPAAVGQTETDETYRQWVVELMPDVRAVVQAVSRKYRLRWDEADELTSLVCFKLVSNRYAALRQFEGKSSIRTYLTTLATRVWLDVRTARYGKWRPSADAMRLGSTALLLERFLWRDGLSVSEACHALLVNHGVAESHAELLRLREQLPQRRPPVRLLPCETVANAPAPDGSDQQPEDDPRRRRAVRRALDALNPDDRRLMVRRYLMGQSVVGIARDLSTEPKALYRRYERILASLRKSAAVSSTVAGQ